jgi:hypothetical protein
MVFWLLFFLVKPIGFVFIPVVRVLCGLLIGAPRPPSNAALSLSFSFYILWFELCAVRLERFSSAHLTKLGISLGWVVCDGSAISTEDRCALAGIGAIFPLTLSLFACFIETRKAPQFVFFFSFFFFFDVEVGRSRAGFPPVGKTPPPTIPRGLLCADLLTFFLQMTGINSGLMNLTDMLGENGEGVGAIVNCAGGRPFDRRISRRKIRRRIIWCTSLFGVADIADGVLGRKGNGEE